MEIPFHIKPLNINFNLVQFSFKRTIPLSNDFIQKASSLKLDWVLSLNIDKFKWWYLNTALASHLTGVETVSFRTSFKVFMINIQTGEIYYTVLDSKNVNTSFQFAFITRIKSPEEIREYSLFKEMQIIKFGSFLFKQTDIGKVVVGLVQKLLTIMENSPSSQKNLNKIMNSLSDNFIDKKKLKIQNKTKNNQVKEIKK